MYELHKFWAMEVVPYSPSYSVQERNEILDLIGCQQILFEALNLYKLTGKPVVIPGD